MTATDGRVTCCWCQEDAQEPELVGFEVTAGSGPDGWPLYRCAACGPKATRPPEPRAAFSQELVAAIAWSLGADVLRQTIAAAQGRAER